MGKAPAKQEPKAAGKPKAKAPAKARPRRRSARTIKGDLEGALEDLINLASSEPYMADAQAFLTQAIACLGKQVAAEGIGEGPAKPATEAKGEGRGEA